jgi:hypothetical protein
LQGQLGFAQHPHVAGFPRTIWRSQDRPCGAILFGSGSKRKCQKRSRPKGRLQFGRWFVRLEEDHAANLEDIEILESPADVFAKLVVKEAVATGATHRG